MCQAQNVEQLKEAFYNLDQILKAKQISLPEFQGDKIIPAIVHALKTHNFDVDQVTLCKALIGHCLQHPNFVTIPVVQQLYTFSL